MAFDGTGQPTTGIFLFQWRQAFHLVLLFSCGVHGLWEFDSSASSIFASASSLSFLSVIMIHDEIMIEDQLSTISMSKKSSTNSLRGIVASVIPGMVVKVNLLVFKYPSIA